MYTFVGLPASASSQLPASVPLKEDTFKTAILVQHRPVANENILVRIMEVPKHGTLRDSVAFKELGIEERGECLC